MTDLQTSLIVIGCAIVFGVIAYNKWQEYKARRNVERAFSTAPDDVLMASGVPVSRVDSTRQEPSFSAEPAAAATYPSSVSDGAHDANDTAASMPAHVRELPVDPLVDCVISVTLDAPVYGEKIILPLQGLRHVGSKPVHFIGQREDGHWEAIVHGNLYTALQAGVRLANRSTALNEIEYSELVMRLRQIADEIGAEPDIPDMTTVMISARALHQFVTDYDAKLSVNIFSNGAPWAVTTLFGALERQGFDSRPDGRLVMPDGDGGILFALSTNVALADDTTSRLTLLLDVPCVAPARDGFGAMVACAKALAVRLDGTVVDDGNQPLSDAALDQIAEQVNAFCSDMEAADIPAGSSRALRLFN